MNANVQNSKVLKLTDAQTLGNPEALEAVTVKPFYETTARGVFYIAVETDKEGHITEKPPLRLADTIHLIGRGTDSAGGHYRVIEWVDKITHCQQTAVIPMAEIGTPQGWRQLQSMGIAIMASRRKRELLADYLQTDGLQTRYTITEQAGWCAGNKAYVLPSGEVMTTSDTDKHTAVRVIYNGDKSQATAYTPAGNLEGWQQHLARYMAGNSRLSLAIGTALAAPLVSLLGMEAGGFHLFGDSRDGKTTAAGAALSVWGKPSALMLTWTGTGYGFANVANARNDGLLVLDEIGQAQPRHVSNTAYSVINGVSKVQGAKEGGNRHISRWRVLLLSTGEKPLDSFLQQAKTEWNAGQAARLPSLPSNAGYGYGIFDALHGYSKGSELSEALDSAGHQHHGHAGRAMIQLLLDKPDTLNEAKDLMAAFMTTLPDMDGQSRTVAMRFALVAAALALAARHGITGQSEGLAFPAIKQCFDAWLERTGTGKYEDARIIEQATAFMQQFAHSHRFMVYPTGAQDRTPPDLVGYRKITEDSANDMFYILPAIFSAEICQSFDKGKVCEVLHAAEWLQRNEADRRWQHKLKGMGRFFLLIGSLPPDDKGDN